MGHVIEVTGRVLSDGGAFASLLAALILAGITWRTGRRLRRLEDLHRELGLAGAPVRQRRARRLRGRPALPGQAGAAESSAFSLGTLNDAAAVSVPDPRM